jgi:hypothetical protein
MTSPWKQADTRAVDPDVFGKPFHDNNLQPETPEHA